MRQPKPFYRKFTGTWYLQLGKQQINLGSDKDAAWEQYHEIMSARTALTSPTLQACKFFEAYLDWVEKHRSPATYYAATRYLTSFVQFIGKRKQLRHITADQIENWLDENTTWASTTQSDAVSILNRAFAWGRRKKHIKHSPVDDLQTKPKRKRREVVYSPEQWELILSKVKDQQFRDILEFMAETGCRPKEARCLEARHIDLRAELAVYYESESKGEMVQVIYLTEKAKEILERLCKEHPQGPVFLNTQNRPWSKDAIKCRFARLKDKVGIDKLCAYGIRHSFATEGLKNGVDSTSLAVIMGHADVSMISRTYQHLAKNLDYLKEQAKPARA